jgi:hypothetical protein
MKEYIRSRIIMTLEVIVIIPLIFTLTKTADISTSMSSIMNENINKGVDKETIQVSQNQLYLDGIYSPKYTFVGDLTGYAGDCPLCTGYLACPPRTNVLKEGIYFEDKTYGTLRIAASSRKYPCGTIIEFDVGKLSDEPIIAIILDRGVGGNDIDLLSENEDIARKQVGRVKNQEFRVLREGWG